MRFGSGYKNDTIQGWIPKPGIADFGCPPFWVERGAIVLLTKKDRNLFTVITDDTVVRFVVFPALEFLPITADSE